MIDHTQNSVKVGNFQMLPPAADVCQECATAHGPDDAHNYGSLYYQYRFFGLHGRWPNWGDAIAHLSEPLQKLWREQLKKHGVPDEEFCDKP